MTMTILYLSFISPFAIRYLSFCDHILCLSILGFRLWFSSRHQLARFSIHVLYLFFKNEDYLYYVLTTSSLLLDALSHYLTQPFVCPSHFLQASLLVFLDSVHLYSQPSFSHRLSPSPTSTSPLLVCRTHLQQD